MAPKFPLSRLLAFSTFSILLLAAPARAQQPVEWDEAASQELAHALHHMHSVWNSGDIAGLKQLMKGDNVLVSFELDPATHRPIILNSKQAIDDFIDRTVRVLDQSGAQTFLEEPTVNCRATANFGVCTEECTIRIVEKGQTRTDRLWSTTAAVKENGTWKWVQWHMSVAEPTTGTGAVANRN
jgi:hypothetical protein